MTLESEMATYKRSLPTLLADEGKFVLIQGEQIAGVYDTYQDALKAGYEKFQLSPFFVKQIWAVEPIQYMMRPLGPCHT